MSLTCQVEYPSLSQHVHVENREKKNFFHAHSLLTLIIFELSGVYCKLFLEDPAKTKLMEFGQFVSDSMPKYVQTVQVTEGSELEILICPEGVIPILTFLRDHTNAQFKQLIDITAVDWPSKPYRFEVCRTGKLLTL